MAKTNMTHERRAGILEWMYAQYDAKHLPALQKVASKAMAAASKAIRTKYPEADMAVLRKYGATRKDSCIQFMNTDTQQVFGVDFQLRNVRSYIGKSMPELDISGLADIPSNGGCRSNQVYPISSAGQKAIEDFSKAVDKFNAERTAKFTDYGAFTLACKTVDEFDEAIPLPDDLRTRYMAGGALIHLSEEKIAELKKEFSPKKRAA